MSTKNQNEFERLNKARQMVAALEQGHEEEADRILAELTTLRETRLYQEVGKLTRQLHDTIASFSLDQRIVELTENDFPDAKERLHYVIAMTEQAANTTLNAVEELIPLSETLCLRSAELSKRWDRFLQRQLPFEEFKDLSLELSRHFEHEKEGAATIQAGLNDILMAQSFQDITGQIIRRVINLVQDIEKSMVGMIRLSDEGLMKDAPSHKKSDVGLSGPVVPGLKSDNAVDSQDEVDDLLSSLGF